MLSRRGSSQATLVLRKNYNYGMVRLRASSRAGKVPGKGPRLPLELLDCIIECYFDEFAPGSLRLMHHCVKTIRLCSQAFNEAALRRVFSTVVIVSSTFWDGIVMLLLKEEKKGAGQGRALGFAWVRELVVGRVYNVLRSPEQLLNFSQLRSLSLDFGSEGLHTQFDCVQKLFGVFSPSLKHSSNNLEEGGAISRQADSNGITQTLTSLKIDKLPCVNRHLLGKIAGTFPKLISLELESNSRLDLSCCSACYEDSLSLTMHSLVTRKFRCAEDLALTFGEALQPLTFLKSLYLGVFLTPEELVENHIAHVQLPRRVDLSDSLPDIQPAAIPSCAQCRESKLLQQASLESIQHQELVASLRVAQFVKSLQVIAWDSVCSRHPVSGKAQSQAEAEPEDAEENGRTRVSKDFKVEMKVIREGGRVRVERLGRGFVRTSDL